jgi:heme/copper-type cytochrome/quinol oxidase subunit 3
MSANRSRSAQPLRDDQTAQAMGVWGLVLGLIVLLMFVAGLAAAALYLETGQPRAAVTGEQETGWPPPGIEVPSSAMAGLAFVALVGTGVALTAAVRRMASDAAQHATLLTAIGLVTAVSAGIALVADLQRAPFGWGEHAYTSIYWALTGATILFVGVAAVMAASLLVQLLTGVIDARRHLEMFNTMVYAWFTVLASAVLLALVHLLPVVAGPS